MAGRDGSRVIHVYADASGREPFTEWLESLRDRQAQIRIRTRLDRVRAGNLGDTAPVGEGVRELRFFFGPGYRVYYAEDGDTIVLLLRGGVKDDQSRDVEAAKRHWRDYGGRKR